MIVGAGISLCAIFSLLTREKEIQFNEMLLLKCIHSALWRSGSRIFGKKYANWENVIENFECRFELLLNRFRFEYGNIGDMLLSLINECNKTALVLPSNEAESYVTD